MRAEVPLATPTSASAPGNLFGGFYGADQLGGLAGVEQEAAAGLADAQNVPQPLGAMTVRILDEQQATLGERFPDLVFNLLNHKRELFET